LFQAEEIYLTKAAQREFYEYNLTLTKVLECLNHGVDSGEKRKEGITEKCIIHKKRILKIVVAESWDYSLKKIVWRVVHIGLVRGKLKI